ncbi:hypothetical protein PR048_028788 [Dryococelus australis]|uniref:Reverse transcriptase RNase H-like domain-containing protein n=1 Tax=Dryococelus australis TaxID=614101 RepID=A0ABQ9GBI8_9NEOP|nr:hypothetical protein PR048_028788 [Dryococelus australis]
MLGYFSRFIDEYTGMCACLNHLCKKNVTFKWTEKQEKAFVFPTSSIALGGALLQDQGEGLKPIAFASRMLSKNEKHLSNFEKEALACVWGVEKFNTASLILFTDNQALTWLYSHPKHIGKIGRWIMRLNGFHFNIIHIWGKANVIASCLSRMYDQDDYESSSACSPVNNYEEEGSGNEECYVMIRMMLKAFTNFPDWQKDMEYRQIRKQLYL